jgi:hypothetical protein
VIGIAPMSPHAALGDASTMFWHEPTGLPFAVGMHTRPRSVAQPGIVLREPSHAAPTVEPDA